MLLLFSHVRNVRGRPVVYKSRGAPRSPLAAGEFVCRSLDWYPFDHSAPDLFTRIRCLGLRHESVPPGDIEMDKLLRNQGAQILGDKLKCNNSWQTHKNSKYYFLLTSNNILSPQNVMWQKYHFIGPLTHSSNTTWANFDGLLVWDFTFTVLENVWLFFELICL